MDTHNFWFWFLDGVSHLVGVLSGRLPLYAPIGLGPYIYGVLVAALTPLVFILGSFVNLCWFLLFFNIFLLSELARGATALYRQVIKFIPFP